MNKFKGEQGAALVITLFIITIMLLVVLTLFYQVTNTAKQVTTMEKNIDARHIAEMGLTYCQQSYKQETEHFQSVMNENGIDQLKNIIQNFNRSLQEGAPKSLDGNRSYAVNAMIKNSDMDEIVVECTSTGTAFGKDVMEKSTITIQLIDRK